MADKSKLPIVDRITGLAQYVARQSRGLLPGNDSSGFSNESPLLQQIPVFAELSAEEQMVLLSRMDFGTLNPGERLFEADERAETLYIIQKGWAKLLTTDTAESELVLGPGEVLEQSAFFLREIYSFTATATTSLEYSSLSDMALTNIVTEFPEIGLKIGLAFGRGIAQYRNYLGSVLNRFELLAELNPFQKYVLSRFLTPQRYVEHETIFCRDDPPTGFFFIETGSVGLFNDELTEPLRLTAGDAFGLEATAYGHLHLYTAQATTDTVVWLLSPADYEKLEHIYPSVKSTFTSTLVNRLSEDFDLAADILAAECDALEIACGPEHPLLKNLEKVRRTILWAKQHRI